MSSGRCGAPQRPALFLFCVMIMIVTICLMKSCKNPRCPGGLRFAKDNIPCWASTSVLQKSIETIGDDATDNRATQNSTSLTYGSTRWHRAHWMCHFYSRRSPANANQAVRNSGEKRTSCRIGQKTLEFQKTVQTGREVGLPLRQGISWVLQPWILTRGAKCSQCSYSQQS